MSESEFFSRKRHNMVLEQIKARGIRDAQILNAMDEVPREVFVPKKFRAAAYEDRPLPIPADQTISQPYVVALMIRALRLNHEDRVLEIGSGSGYAAAVLSRIVREVHGVERHLDLVMYARERLEYLGYDNVFIHHGDGTTGWPPAAPYDGILVSASGPRIPSTLVEQLAVHGRLVMPVGQEKEMQSLIRVTRTAENRYHEKDLGGVRFVPLIGEEGW